MYPRADEWSAVCGRLDPDGVFSSDLSRRLALRTLKAGGLAA